MVWIAVTGLFAALGGDERADPAPDLTVAVADPPRYLYRQLPLPPDATASSAFTLNARGDAAGKVSFNDIRGWLPALWRDGEMTLFPDPEAAIYDMNDHGEVVGLTTSAPSYNDWGRGFYFDGESVHLLPCPDLDGRWFPAYGLRINNAGTIIGGCGTYYNTMWNRTEVSLLDVGCANGINNRGDIVGWRCTVGQYKENSFLLSDGQLTTFGLGPDGVTHVGMDRYLVGIRHEPEYCEPTCPRIAWVQGKVEILPPLQDYCYAKINAVAERNEAVGGSYGWKLSPYGTCGNEHERATIWIEELPVNLNTLTLKTRLESPRYLRMLTAYDISDNGHIVGTSYDYHTRDVRGSMFLRIESILAFEFFAPCLAGPDVQADQECQPFDRNLDGAVDLRDYAAIQNGFR